LPSPLERLPVGLQPYRVAARNKFRISMTLVIGPVPPGTGVIIPAVSTASA